MGSWADLVPLGQLGEVVSGSTPDTSVAKYWGGDIPWITPADLADHSGIYFRGELRKITATGYDSCPTKLLPAGSILFSSRAPIGHCAVTAYLLCTNQGFKTLVPNHRLDPIFGFFALKFFTPDLVALGRGATFLEISKTIFESFRIPLPPLPEQKRIAAILAKADRLHRLRRYALDLSEGYLQAAFLEMFGDPVRNPKGWPRASVSELGCVQTGNTPPRADAENYGDHIEWIKSDNVQNDRVYVSPSREMLSEKGVRRGRAVEAGSALVTCIAGSITSVGDVALTDRRVAYNQQINAITPRPGVDPFFLYGLLKAAQPLVQYNATAGMKHIITKSKLERLALIRPPRRLQQHFGQIVRRHERLRAQQREAARQAEQLFGALLHRAFQGEL